MSKQNNSSKKGIFSTLGRWFKRMFLGSKAIADEMLEGEDAARAADVEKIVSPMRQIVNNFLERKLAVGALVLLIVMFLTMFIAPMFLTKYTDAYTEVTQQNIAPNMSMMKVPKELQGDIKMIDGYGTFTVGLSNAGKVYVWGSTQIGTTGVDVSEIPEDVRNANIVMIAAGIDHIVAIDDKGIVHAWGYNKLGQYGTLAEAEAKGEEINPNIAYMPEILVTEGIDVTQVKKLTCGYQATAILMNDGTLYLWGNKNAYANMDLMLLAGNFHDVDFTLNYIVGVNGKPRNTLYTGSRGLYDVVRAQIGDKGTNIKEFIGKRQIDSITACSTSVAILLDDGTMCFAGDFTSDVLKVPAIPADEKIIDIQSGSYHYTALTDKGTVYSWGRNTYNQAAAPEGLSGVGAVYTGSYQSYTTDAQGKLMDTWGLKGYAFGTDTRGADIFQRVIMGGKMTMTIGAVAVIISSVIGIIIGCVAGYFGGKVDILLMRVAEIFGAIPFIPFAMILSAILGTKDVSENMRIFIIMCILGVLSWTGLARLVRGQVLVVRESEYVTAAKAMGVKENKIAFKHILPNVMSVILVNLMLNFGTCMLTESSLSYLGFGVQYPRPTWGNMLNGANNATIINSYWWQWLFPAVFLAITTICINIVGDALRDVMDPKSSVER